MPDNEPLDYLIDSALGTYGDSEADPELARHVLERISAVAQPAPRRRWLPWAIALPVAATLLILAVLSGPVMRHRSARIANQAHQSHDPDMVTKAESAIMPQAASTAHPNPAMPRPHRLLAAATAEAAPLPKLDVFPTPEPLTPGERALAGYIARAPEAERHALVESQQQIDQPLSIAAIEIKPLEPPEADSN